MRYCKWNGIENGKRLLFSIYMFLPVRLTGIDEVRSYPIVFVIVLFVTKTDGWFIPVHNLRNAGV